jgi:hypothetical protein
MLMNGAGKGRTVIWNQPSRARRRTRARLPKHETLSASVACVTREGPAGRIANNQPTKGNRGASLSGCRLAGRPTPAGPDDHSGAAPTAP